MQNIPSASLQAVHLPLFRRKQKGGPLAYKAYLDRRFQSPKCPKLLGRGAS